MKPDHTAGIKRAALRRTSDYTAATAARLQGHLAGYREAYGAAYKAGFHDGAEEAYYAGLADGYEAGYADGHGDGRDAGEAEARERVKVEASDAIYRDGYADGLADHQAAIDRIADA